MPEPLHVLYVDDYEPMGEMVADALADDGFLVTVMTDALAALQLCMSIDVHFGAAVIDFNMPGMDGDELTRRLSEAGHMPIVVVSAFIDDERRQRAMQAGARAVMDKKDLVRILPGLLRQLMGAA